MTATLKRHARTLSALENLRRDIVSGRFQHVEMLPGERELALGLSVSRTTLRRMLADLVEEGVLRHRQGVGTFVTRPGPSSLGSAVRPDRAPPRLLGFTEDMQARGVSVTTVDIARSVVRPSPDEAMMLACSPEEPVIRLIRLRMQDQQVLAVEQAAVPCRFIARPGSIGTSLYEALEDSGHPPVRALQRLQAITLGGSDAARLLVPPGSAGMVVRRAAYVRSGACCEFTRSAYSGSLYDAVTEKSVVARDLTPHDASSVSA